ncbi:hypothetical protein AYI68_g5957 [Smittium mucronatum]|uniref:Uncharacterized protein n=1 Tax=Smittium mucronatum TaxID=133383 RepID=A0A1R0GSV7_9FUNG|nr:hypothetical protein AYI68_g5957 [Smittium mucronatum]
MKIFSLTSSIFWFGGLVVGGIGPGTDRTELYDFNKDFECNDGSFFGFQNEEKIKESYERGFKNGYAKCLSNRKARKHAHRSPITPRNVSFMKYSINNRCDNGQCDLDLIFGKRKTDVLARIQCVGCPNKISNLQCMNKLADELGEGRNQIKSSYFGCKSYGSWTFTPQKVGDGNQIEKMNVAKYGDLLPAPKRRRNR